MKIKIYQVNTDRDENRIAFADYEEYVKRTGNEVIDAKDYDCVFDGEVDCRDLEDVYYMFNDVHPEGYKGRSVSVSDVIEIVESDVVDKGFYFCDFIGYKAVKFESELAAKKVDKITVLIIEPGKYPRIEKIGTSLYDLQKVVDGDIEPIYPFEEEVCIVGDGESKLKGKELNRGLYGDGKLYDIMAGTFFICGCGGENFSSLTKEQQEKYTKMFFYPERFVRMNDEICGIKYKPEKYVDAR